MKKILRLLEFHETSQSFICVTGLGLLIALIVNSIENRMYGWVALFTLLGTVFLLFGLVGGIFLKVLYRAEKYDSKPIKIFGFKNLPKDKIYEIRWKHIGITGDVILDLEYSHPDFEEFEKIKLYLSEFSDTKLVHIFSDCTKKPVKAIKLVQKDSRLELLYYFFEEKEGEIFVY